MESLSHLGLSLELRLLLPEHDLPFGLKDLFQRFCLQAFDRADTALQSDTLRLSSKVIRKQATYGFRPHHEVGKGRTVVIRPDDLVFRNEHEGVVASERGARGVRRTASTNQIKLRLHP